MFKNSCCPDTESRAPPLPKSGVPPGVQCLAQGGGSSRHLSAAIFCLQSNCERGELPLPGLCAPRGLLALLLSQASISRAQVLSGLPSAGLVPSTLLSVTPRPVLSHQASGRLCLHRPMGVLMAALSSWFCRAVKDTVQERHMGVRGGEGQGTSLNQRSRGRGKGHQPTFPGGTDFE